MRRRVWLPVLLAGSLMSIAPLACAQPAAPVNAGSAAANLATYRDHLQALEALVVNCRKLRTPEACNPSQVGADDSVPWPAGGAIAQRAIQYDWLRQLLQHAAAKGGPTPASGLNLDVRGSQTPPVSVDELLNQAQQRLEGDLRQAGGSSPQAQPYSAERQSLGAILARREYRGTAQISAKERLQEWLENLIERILEKLIGIGARAPWLGYLLEGLLVAALATALIWALIRLEQRARVRFTPEVERAGAAPSAREWQLWLKDAQAMAAQMRWREAIHFLYWASISRLESMRLWPADNARTPREYLRLLARTDPRLSNLTALTRSFERTWYGGREAHSADFQAALEIAAALGVE